jgi:hypothetical protein
MVRLAQQNNVGEFINNWGVAGHELRRQVVASTYAVVMSHRFALDWEFRDLFPGSFIP